MKYLFIISGIGIGHAIREDAIIKEIQKRNKKAEIRVVSYGNTYKYFKNKFKTFKIKGYYYPDDVPKFGIIKTLKKNYKALFEWSEEITNLNNYIDKYNPDIVISDWEPLALFIKQKTIFVFNYDPTIKIKLNKSLALQKLFLDTVYNMAKSKDKTVVITSLNKKKIPKVKKIDLIIRKRPEELPPVKTLMKKLKLKKHPIIIEVGGSRFGYKLIEKIIRIAPQFNEDFLIFNYPGKNTKNIQFSPFKENFLEYLKCCKAIITLAGHCTLSEALVYKKPCLSYPIENHIEQLMNAEVFKNYTLVRDIRSNEKEILDHIKQLLKYKIKKAKIKGDGASEIYEIIKNVYRQH